MTGFQEEVIHSWIDFTRRIIEFRGEWLYRGLDGDFPLATRFERALTQWGIPLHDAAGVEVQIVREYGRRYDGFDREDVCKDFLYCLAVIQHYGGPTRLLDWTYSPYIAAQFALGRGSCHGVVWCVRAGWIDEGARKIAGNAVCAARNDDRKRTDETFLPLYQAGDKAFVTSENPLRLNPRVRIQQAVFLCPGAVSQGFEENLKAMSGWDNPNNVLKLRFDLPRDAALEIVFQLMRMNLHSAILFPGEDGLATSLGERMPLFANFAARRVGTAEAKPWTQPSADQHTEVR